MQKATRQHTKDHNTRLVLRTLFRQDDISRADIARATGLTRPTVSAIIAELMEAGLAIETGVGQSAGGKPPILLRVDADAHHILSIDLGSRNFRTALINLRGEIISQLEETCDGRQGEDALALVFQMTDELLEKCKTPVIGIGIGTPGVIDPERGIIQSAVNLGWSSLPIRERFAARYDLPVHIANDSHAAALAEYLYGGPRESKSLILVKVSRGIGAGIILEGQPFYGDGFGAGEIGHLVVNPQGSQCSCGNIGCLETVASTQAILAQARAMAKASSSSMLSYAAADASQVTWDDVVRAFRAGDEQTTQLITEVGRYLGVALAALIATLNVHTLVISGRISQLGDGLLEAARIEARRRAYPKMANATTIRFSPLGQEIVLLGCTTLVLKEELGVV
jgi:glucokinase-like ROK family protein